MRGNVGMAVVKKRQKQDYFSEQSILLTLPAYISHLQSVALMMYTKAVKVVLLALLLSASPE